MKATSVLVLGAGVVTATTQLVPRAVCPSIDSDHGVWAILPKPQGYICGQQGRLMFEAPLKTLNSCSAETIEACRDACFTQAACKSFRYDYNTHSCSLFSKQISHQGFQWTPKTTTSPVHYARQCFQEIYTGDYLQDGGFDEYESEAEDSNTGFPHWNIGPGTDGTQTGHIHFNTFSPGHDGAHSIFIECQNHGTTESPTDPCHFSLSQTILGISHAGAYTLTWESAAWGADFTKGVTVKPYLDGIIPPRGSMIGYPCAESETCAVSAGAATWYPFYSTWKVPAASPSSVLLLNIDLPVGFGVLFDGMTFKYASAELPPMKMKRDLIRSVEA